MSTDSRSRTSLADDIWPDVLARVGPDLALGEALSRWAQASPGPLVLLIDEIDTLVGDSLLSVLQQLRAGYPTRPDRFPHSVVLCGLRDPRDYRMDAAGSPFNIAAASLRRCAAEAGHLVVIDRRDNRSWEEGAGRRRYFTSGATAVRSRSTCGACDRREELSFTRLRPRLRAPLVVAQDERVGYDVWCRPSQSHWEG